MLQARFAIVRGPARFFYHGTLHDIMKACIILHNMIIEDERDGAEAVDLDFEKFMRFHVHQCHMSRQMNFRNSFKFINALGIKKLILISK